MLHTRVLPASLSGSMKGGADPFIFLRAVFARAAGERRDNVAFVLIHETAEDETSSGHREGCQTTGNGDQQTARQIRDDGFELANLRCAQIGELECDARLLIE